MRYFLWYLLAHLTSPKSQGCAVSVFYSLFFIECLKSLATAWPLFSYYSKCCSADFMLSRSRTSIFEIVCCLSLFFFFPQEITKAQKYTPMKVSEIRVIPESPGIHFNILVALDFFENYLFYSLVL